MGGDNGTDTAYKYRSPSYNPPPYYGYYDYTLGNVSVGDEIDFRVQAIIGYSTRINTTFSGPPIGLEPGESYHYHTFTGEVSDWSNTQTITIGASAPTATPNAFTSPTQNPTSTPQQVSSQSGALFGLNWQSIAIIVLSVMVAALLVVVVVFLRRRSVQPVV